MTMPEWIGTPAADERNWSRSVIDCFHAAVAERAEALFVTDGALRLTYAEADRAARHLAAALHDRAPHDRPIGIMVGNGAALVIAVLACATLGRIAVQIDINGPADRQAVILREAGVGAIAALDDSTIDPTLIAGVPVIRFSATPTGDAPTLPPVTQDLEAPFVLSFTSGSTGDPKGIVFAQRHSLAVSGGYVDQVGIDARSVLVSLASVSPVSMRDAYAALLSGACVHYIDLKTLGLGAALRAWRDAQATHVTFVPSAMRGLAALPGTAAALASLTALSLIGEATTADDIALFRRILPAGCRISLGIGATETGLLGNWIVDEAKITAPLAPAGYMRPERVYSVRDANDAPVAQGEIGELVISDRWVSLGYWRAGALTDSFAPNPGDPGPRTCRTGDLIRIRDDGLIEHVGRADRMHKVRGLRVDLADVEAALRAIDAVADAAVVVTERAGAASEMTAFVAWRAGMPALPTVTLRRHVEQRTAPHMVPHHFRFVDALPQLHNGKTDLVTLARLAEAP